MPFTPFHFGPCACVGLPLRKRIDLPVFILSNVVIDLEPGTVMLLGLDLPLHGFFHSFLIGALVGLAWACVAWRGRGILKRLMEFFRIPYETSFKKMVFSGVLGVWFHVILDAPLYRDIHPFYPFKFNPFFGILSPSAIYGLSALSFLPALVLYALVVRSRFLQK